MPKSDKPIYIIHGATPPILAVGGGICRNCKFWEKRKDANFGDCSKFDDAWLGDSGDEVLAAVTYSDSILHTKAEFGCIHFEVKKCKSINVTSATNLP